MKPNRNADIRDRARAARLVLGDRTTHKDMEMAAFMSIFHPEVKGRRLKKLLRHEAKT